MIGSDRNSVSYFSLRKSCARFCFFCIQLGIAGSSRVRFKNSSTKQQISTMIKSHASFQAKKISTIEREENEEASVQIAIYHSLQREREREKGVSEWY